MNSSNAYDAFAYDAFTAKLLHYEKFEEFSKEIPWAKFTTDKEKLCNANFEAAEGDIYAAAPLRIDFKIVSHSLSFWFN